MKNNKLVVVHYIWSANFGGIEKLVMDLSLAQRSNNRLETQILIGCRKGNFIDKLNETGLTHTFVGMKNGNDVRPSILKLLRNKFIEADIIHIHTFNPIVYLMAGLSGKKIIFTVHGNFFFGRKKRITDSINQFLRKLILPAFTSYITYNSRFSKQLSDQLFNTGKIKGVIIPNGIFLENSSNTEMIPDKNHRDFIANKFVVGTSSRFVGVKRIDRLIQGFALFAKDKNDVVLMLVGDGILKDQIKMWVSNHDIQSKTLLTGFQSAVRSYQNSMDVCVFSSQNEAFGLVAVETLGLGKPTIVFKDAGGMLEIVENEFNEDIVEDEQQLCSRLNHYYNNRYSLDKELITKRMNLARDYTIQKMEERIYQVYKDVIAKTAEK